MPSLFDTPGITVVFARVPGTDGVQTVYVQGVYRAGYTTRVYRDAYTGVGYPTMVHREAYIPPLYLRLRVLEGSMRLIPTYKQERRRALCASLLPSL